MTLTGSVNFESTSDLQEYPRTAQMNSQNLLPALTLYTSDNEPEQKRHAKSMPILFQPIPNIQKATFVRNYVTAMASTKPLVLFFSPVRHATQAYEKLQEVAHTEVVTSRSRNEFFNDVAIKYRDAFAIYRTSASGSVSASLIYLVSRGDVKEYPSLESLEENRFPVTYKIL